MGGALQPDPVSSRASAEAAESVPRVSRTPLDQGEMLLGPLFLLFQFPQPLLGLPPTSTAVSPSSALVSPGGPKLGVSASICGLPILSFVLPGTAQHTHCGIPGPQRHQDSSS